LNYAPRKHYLGVAVALAAFDLLIHATLKTEWTPLSVVAQEKSPCYKPGLESAAEITCKPQNRNESIFYCYSTSLRAP